ncbi:MAG: hypothetical protein NT120_05080 [Candidatus Aenigmarchaeota archaeon]|nr:hypothetical protein [Candidatus Aenigmarchaeota archaeon]
MTPSSDLIIPIRVRKSGRHYKFSLDITEDVAADSKPSYRHAIGIATVRKDSILEHDPTTIDELYEDFLGLQLVRAYRPSEKRNLGRKDILKEYDVVVVFGKPDMIKDFLKQGEKDWDDPPGIEQY